MRDQRRRRGFGGDFCHYERPTLSAERFDKNGGQDNEASRPTTRKGVEKATTLTHMPRLWTVPFFWAYFSLIQFEVFFEMYGDGDLVPGDGRRFLLPGGEARRDLRHERVEFQPEGGVKPHRRRCLEGPRPPAASSSPKAHSRSIRMQP